MLSPIQHPAQSNTAQYGLTRRVPLTYEQTLERVRKTLAEQGFGVLTEIDVKKTLKQKLDKEFPPYVILGACNPALAYRALTAEPDIGLLLPCNVTVYEDAQGKTVVAAIDPMTLVNITGRKDLQDLAQEVHSRLIKALNAV